MPLSDIKIRNAKPKEKPYKLADGGGLFVLVKPTGSKLWQLKYRYLGKEKIFSAGPYPLVGAAEARAIRDNVKKLLANGTDPTQHRRVTKQLKMEACENTFEAVARRWLSIKKIEDSHEARSLRRLELHAFPRIGLRPIGEIKTLELANCLEAIEKEGINETAHRIKQLIQQTFRYAVRKGLIEHNPAGDLRDIIGHEPVTSRACIPPAELPQLLRDMETYKGDRLTKAAMRLLLLCFTQAHEGRDAEKNLKAFISEHGSARFEAAWKDGADNAPIDRKTIQRAGFKRMTDAETWEYFILPSVFEKEVIGSLNKSLVKLYLAQRGLIVRDAGGKFTVSIRVPGVGQTRLYHVPASILDGEGDHADA
jgi:hypothetical protein